MLLHPQFRKLYTAQVVALVGTGLLTVALGLLAYNLAGADAGAVLGTALAIKMIAYVAVAPIISALVHRLPRRVVLVSADVVRASIALLLPFVTRTWEIYILIALLQSASATFTPAFQSLIPAILDDEEDYTRGLSLSRMAYDGEALVSPILAAALLTVISFNLLFVGTAAGFVASALLVVTTRLPQLPIPERAAPLWHRITEGARFMAERPALRSLLAMNMVVAAPTALVIVDTVVYVRDRLGGSNTDVALALGCFGFGSMIVALAAPRVLRVLPDRRVMLTGCVVLPIGLLVTAIVPELGPVPGGALLAVSWAVLGAGTSLINTPSARLLRAQTEPAARPAVFTAQFSLSHACFLVTYPMAGRLGVLAGLPITAVALAALATLAGAMAARLWPASVPSGIEVAVSAGR
ncbi:MFS transporter [Nocardia sp. NPDC020380]|uniref:MFS transporter n=1 Tax=Nocardia sp. NPDC020380 TaxID=3364309 RepID=UPI00378A5A7E